MTAKKPLANPRLAAKVAAGNKAGLDSGTPTHITAILSRIGKLERAQRASLPDQLLRKLDALGKIVANLQESHGSLAQWAHQELAEIRLALLDEVQITGDVGMPQVDIDGFAQFRKPPVSPEDIALAKQLWPDAVRLTQPHLEEFARQVRHAQQTPNGVLLLPRELLQPLRWWQRFIPFR